MAQSVLPSLGVGSQATPEGNGETGGPDPIEHASRVQAQQRLASQTPVQTVGAGAFYRPTHGEYTLAPEWREWALQQLGVTPSQVQVDLFSTEKKAARSLFVTKAMDAFTFSWQKLVNKEDEFLWANPPF